MAQFIPPHIELTSSEAFQIVASLESAIQALADTGWVTISMELDDAHAILIDKLFPEDQE